jgi:hypothetical protein
MVALAVPGHRTPKVLPLDGGLEARGAVLGCVPISKNIPGYLFYFADKP